MMSGNIRLLAHSPDHLRTLREVNHPEDGLIWIWELPIRGSD